MAVGENFKLFLNGGACSLKQHARQRAEGGVVTSTAHGSIGDERARETLSERRDKDDGNR